MKTPKEISVQLDKTLRLHLTEVLQASEEDRKRLVKAASQVEQTLSRHFMRHP